VKTDNLFNLAKPLGLSSRLEEESEALIVPADTLGARRGTIAQLGTVTDARRSDDGLAAGPHSSTLTRHPVTLLKAFQAHAHLSR